MAALLRAFRRDRLFDTVLTASGPALETLRRDGEDPIAFSFSDNMDHLGNGDDYALMLEAARKLLSETAPDAVLASLSSGGVGVDEALVASATIPTFVMQDFWGDVNLGLGAPAGLYLVPDDDSVELTRHRWGVDAVAVGLPKYSEYRQIDVLALRRTGRNALGVRDEQKVIGFFGQLPTLPGHAGVFQCLLDAVSTLDPKPLLLLREHPKYPGLLVDHASRVEGFKLDIADVTGKLNAETWLAACDVVTTSFSLTGLDHAYLSANSPEPIGSVLYLMTNEEIRDYVEEKHGFVKSPIVNHGIGLFAESPDAVPQLLRDALGSGSTSAYHDASKRLSMGDPCQAVIDTITEVLAKSTGPGATAR
jgi:hypothetical protein